MNFLEGMKRANLSSHDIMSEPITLNGTPMNAAIDDMSRTSFARSGVQSEGQESALFVREDDFIAASGRRGSIVTLPNGKTSQVKKISNFQGVLYLVLAPFKP